MERDRPRRGAMICVFTPLCAVVRDELQTLRVADIAQDVVICATAQSCRSAGRTRVINRIRKAVPSLRANAALAYYDTAAALQKIEEASYHAIDKRSTTIMHALQGALNIHHHEPIRCRPVSGPPLLPVFSRTTRQ